MLYEIISPDAFLRPFIVDYGIEWKILTVRSGRSDSMDSRTERLHHSDTRR